MVRTLERRSNARSERHSRGDRCQRLLVITAGDRIDRLEGADRVGAEGARHAALVDRVTELRTNRGIPRAPARDQRSRAARVVVVLDGESIERLSVEAVAGEPFA